MDKTMSSDNGLITLVNGFEVAFISVMPSEKDFRNPESFPCLHDKVLAAAANAASSGPGFLSGIVKGMKGKTGNTMNVSGSLLGSNVTQLENIFFAPLSETSTLVSNDKEVGDLTIDDIEEIDDPLPLESTSTHANKHGRKGRASVLGFHYNKDATAAAEYTRNKLAERQEKLQRISDRTAELESGAKNFAEMANELVKTMEEKNRFKLW
ncbi:hypothetical protein QJS04_geneDACA010595 [Acorus gramineus]|uniref:V-SNARE coiled-coil homology domain-containing protein n=1 Tax=Acorus gramineus TaxID=55184 RepID=A0AAV9AJY4_ACOGR|nr:hypothetical protein QJS04_geneDACA010595 [Acorus gramineus]